MKYDEVIERLCKFQKIFVTGPQRSGTTIAGKMIAKDLGYRYIDEGEHAAGADANKLRFYINNIKEFVVQCPILASAAHRITNWDQNNSAIVYMCRNCDDIYKSQKRINWNWDEAEKRVLKEAIQLERIEIDMDFTRNISALKYQLWYDYQKSKINHSFDLEYESMSDHPMWLAKNKRDGFHAKQTSL